MSAQGPTASIGWLHLSDLHQGPEPDGLPRSGFTSDVRDDLARMHERSGPWEVVLFSGDLALTGREEEYTRVGEVLEKLWEVLKALGSEPGLLAVPGNHDLRRPEPGAAAVRALRRWHDDPDLREAFWSSPKGEYRSVVREAFAPYEEFIARRELPASFRVNKGALPGDFAATIERDGVRLGVVGLNTNFLHFDDSARGSLVLDPHQLRAVCDDAETWAAGHHATLLLTHHGPAWLDLNSQYTYAPEIFFPGRFVLHLASYQHVEPTLLREYGGMLLGCPPLAALWPFGSARRYPFGGYNAGRIEVSGGEGTVRVWPRITVPDDPPFFRVVASPAVSLDQDDSFAVRFTARGEPAQRSTTAVHTLSAGNPFAPTRPRSTMDRVGLARAVLGPAGAQIMKNLERGRGQVSKGTAPRRQLRPPDAPYDSDWFVNREAELKAVLAALAQPGRSVVVWGPERFGKTSLLDRVTATIQGESDRAMAVRVDVSRFEKESLESPNAFFRELAERFVEAAGGSAAWLDAAKRQHRSAAEVITRLIERHALPATRGRLVLVVDGADHVFWSRVAGEVLDAFGNDLDYGGGAESWARFHVVLAVSSPPDLLARVARRMNIDRLPAVEIGDLASESLRRLADLHGLAITDEEIARMGLLIGGHPYLARVAMYHAATNGLRLGDVLANTNAKGDVFAEYIERTRWWLWQYHGVPDALRRVAKNGEAPREVGAYARLFQLGLVKRDPSGGCRLRGTLYERLLR